MTWLKMVPEESMALGVVFFKKQEAVCSKSPERVKYRAGGGIRFGPAIISTVCFSALPPPPLS